MPDVDPCVFYKKVMIVLCCADDFLKFAQDSRSIEYFCTSLQEDFTCTNEVEVDEHLVVEIKKNENTITLKQPQLIDRNLSLLEAKDANLKSTPVVKLLLYKNTNGKDRSRPAFHYRSIIGIL